MHRPHPTKLECASAFDPIRDLARDLDAQVDERVPQLALRQILHEKLAPVGDSRCLEGWTWKELKDRDVSAAAESLLATTVYDVTVRSPRVPVQAQAQRSILA